MKTAIVYDRVNKWGGAERVLLALHEIYPKAELFTSVYHQDAKWAKVFPKIHTSFLNKISLLRNKHELIPFLMPLAFESFNFENFDLVISVTSESAKGIVVKDKTKHICYCLTPTRYLWHAKDLLIKSKLFTPIVYYLQKWDIVASRRPDQIIAISDTVKERIKKYYERNSFVVYPPVDLSVFKKTKHKNKKHFLIVSRLVVHKKIDYAIKAFNELGLPLHVVGVGRDEKRLKKIAHSNIKFLGEISDKKLLEEYSSALALIFPQEEDFGLVSIEAQAVGTPVIAFKKGGAVETVVDGLTGILFPIQSIESLKRAIQRFVNTKFQEKEIINNAKKFSKINFKKQFVKTVRKLL